MLRDEILEPNVVCFRFRVRDNPTNDPPNFKANRNCGVRGGWHVHAHRLQPRLFSCKMKRISFDGNNAFATIQCYFPAIWISCTLFILFLFHFIIIFRFGVGCQLVSVLRGLWLWRYDFIISLHCAWVGRHTRYYTAGATMLHTCISILRRYNLVHTLHC